MLKDKETNEDNEDTKEWHEDTKEWHEDSWCHLCGGTMTWCICCRMYTSECCQDYGTCACS